MLQQYKIFWMKNMSSFYQRDFKVIPWNIGFYKIDKWVVEDF